MNTAQITERLRPDGAARTARIAPTDLEFRPRSVHGGLVPAPADRNQLVDGTGSMRRVQALVAFGRSVTQIAVELGHAPHVIEMLVAGPAIPLWYDIALSIAILFERWSGTPGPCAIARSRGKTARWATPMAWYDIDIDDPSTTALTNPPRAEVDVDELKVRMAMGGAYPWARLSPAERDEVQRRLIRGRVRPHHVGELLKLQPKTIAAYRLAYDEAVGGGHLQRNSDTDGEHRTTGLQTPSHKPRTARTRHR